MAPSPYPESKLIKVISLTKRLLQDSAQPGIMYESQPQLRGLEGVNIRSLSQLHVDLDDLGARPS